jgi:hypothetical protein
LSTLFGRPTAFSASTGRSVRCRSVLDTSSHIPGSDTPHVIFTESTIQRLPVQRPQEAARLPTERHRCRVVSAASSGQCCRVGRQALAKLRP